MEFFFQDREHFFGTNFAKWRDVRSSNVGVRVQNLVNRIRWIHGRKTLGIFPHRIAAIVLTLCEEADL